MEKLVVIGYTHPSLFMAKNVTFEYEPQNEHIVFEDFKDAKIVGSNYKIHKSFSRTLGLEGDFFEGQAFIMPGMEVLFVAPDRKSDNESMEEMPYNWTKGLFK